jgi:putative Holliday junction resolvase
VLAIDYGRRRLGLALSDELRLIARPLGILERTNRGADLARIRDLCRRHAVGEIVVGWPLRLDGTPGEMAQEAAQFAERLRKNLGKPVELADERLSSWEAVQNASFAGRRQNGKPMDDLAAAVILRDYLSNARASAGLKAGAASKARAKNANGSESR